MAEEPYGECEDHDPHPREHGLSLQKRQARVTVKYNRKELQKRLNVEKWLEEALEGLYVGAEDEMPEEIDIDDLLVLQSDEQRAQKLQEVLQTCKNSTQVLSLSSLNCLKSCAVYTNRKNFRMRALGIPVSMVTPIIMAIPITMETTIRTEHTRHSR
ncbi:hypothetical protein P4O66_015904 [Electrophorus voltai]|uniref:Protein phosphatase 1, regulatory (inhibitor) subunit 14Ab n=1 Tax=Electrophorus voltai TaxID=2609070 RepID=A0AAD8YWW5_9TELE|nr:hypothetical protein P4O66_015904 [Electrophorus voltai]